MKKKFQALVFDLDGTAIPNRPDGMPSQAVIDAVQEAKKHCHVSVATGRALPMCRHILDALKIDDLCIISGGTKLLSRKLGKSIWEQNLDIKILKEMLAKLHAFHHYHIGDELMFDDHLDGATIAKGLHAFEPVTLGEYSPQEGVAAPCIIAVTKEDAPKIISIIKEVPGIACHLISSWKPGHFEISITNELATKKHALQALLAHLNVNIEDVMVAGDGGNDMPLFELAGWKVAMGNAHEELKKAADWIAPSVDEDGLAVAIRKFIS